jgi:hypothetical protein
MTSRALYIGVPAGLAALYVLAYLVACLCPLSPIGDLFGNNPAPDQLADNLLIRAVGAGLLSYLIAFALLSVLRPGLGAGARAGLSVGISAGLGTFTTVMTFAAAVAAGLSPGAGRMGTAVEAVVMVYFGPEYVLEKIFYALAEPIQRRHLVGLSTPGYWRNAIDRGTHRVRDSVVWVARDGLAPRDQRALARAFEQAADTETRHAFAEVLKAARVSDRAALLILAGILNDPVAEARKAAARILPDAGGGAPEITQALLKLLIADPDEAVRAQAALSLAVLAPEDPRLKEGLVAAIERGQAYGAMTLFIVDPRDPRVVRAYARYLTTDDPKVRAAWLDHLVDVKLHPIDLLAKRDPSLVRTLADADPAVFKLRPALLASLQHESSAVRLAAIDATEWLYPKDTPFVKVIAKLLKDPDDKVRLRTTSFLAHEREAGDSTIEWGLIGALDDHSSEVASGAGDALYTIHVTNQRVQIAMIEALARHAERHSPAQVSLTVDLEGILSGPGWRAPLATDKVNPNVLRAVTAMLSSSSLRVRRVGVDLLKAIDPQEPRIQLQIVQQLTSAGEGTDGRDLADASHSALLHFSLTTAAHDELRRIAAADNAEAAEWAADVLKKKP